MPGHPNASLDAVPIHLREVGPRDGLQAEPPLSVGERVELIERVVAAGATEVELGAFVSPEAVPAMARSAEVFAAVPAREGLVRTALVPNRRGATDALLAGADALTMTISASAEYNRRNVRRSVEQSLDEVTAVADLARRVPVDAVVSCAFGSPYEGDIAPDEVAALVAALFARGATAVTLADTTGMATPRRIAMVLDVVGVGVGLHLHDTRGTGLANLLAAAWSGVRRFDTSIGGLGGSPFATGSSGNVATEDAVALLDDMGAHTGLDVAALVEAARWLEGRIGHRLAGKVAYAGPRLGPAPPR